MCGFFYYPNSICSTPANIIFTKQISNSSIKFIYWYFSIILSYFNIFQLYKQLACKKAAYNEAEVDERPKKALFNKFDLVIKVFLYFAENSGNNPMIKVAQKGNKDD